MTPQSHFTVVAPVAAGREGALSALLDTMNLTGVAGMADPANSLVPFAEFEALHYARFVILDDPTLGDMKVYDLSQPVLPVYLAFFGDCDGSARAFLESLVNRAGNGLKQIFSHCADFDERTGLLGWLLAHDRRVSAAYVNWMGRTVRQIREEDMLQKRLSAQVRSGSLAAAAGAQQQRRQLIAFAEAERQAGRLTLTEPESTPLIWKIKNFLHLLGVPLLGLITLPFLLPLLPLLAIQLRILETSDPEVYPQPSVDFLATLKRLEDHDVTNQYTALGLVKPCRFRRWLLTATLVLVDYGARHIFARGHLARVQTIHFARWVFLDNKQRVMFASNYDGGHEAYMDDFINKVAWGLNLVFSNGVGWPRTDWILRRGARIEQRFKYFQRRHQLPTQVWYKAYPGLALVDIARNQTIRAGLTGTMTDAEALAWLRLL
jgi:hypothetical protein